LFRKSNLVPKCFLHIVYIIAVKMGSEIAEIKQELASLRKELQRVSGE